MNSNEKYDIGIVGGGLAGLTTAIQFRRKGYDVVLFEKNQYPFHRVCGEYISLESRDYLAACGINIAALQLPVIKKLQVSAPNGKLLEADLDLGGFGISRYLLDDLLFKEAVRLGITVLENTRVEDIVFDGAVYGIHTSTNIYNTRLALGCFGKRSNLDVKWKRDFTIQKPDALNNYIGVKYHIKTDLPADTIALHNFKYGYAGISKIEEDKYCFCYLTTAANLRKTGGLEAMGRNILCQNPHLKNIFENSEFLFSQPVSISQISFDKKETVYNNIPLAGDACGLIAPLCGNGMSMAMHAGKLFVILADAYLQGTISMPELLNGYQQQWQQQFAKRIKTGRWVQANFGKTRQTNVFISFLKWNPWLVRRLIQSTHGDIF